MITSAAVDIGLWQTDCLVLSAGETMDRLQIFEREFIKISGVNPFERMYGDGAILTGVTPHDIFQLGYTAAIFAVDDALIKSKQIKDESPELVIRA